MTLEATVSMGWVNTVLASATQQGVKSSKLLTLAGIEASALTWERWPIDHITRLWRAAEKMTGDLSFGLQVGTQVSLASVNVVGFALQSAATLRDAIGMVQKYQRLISDGGRFQLLGGASASWLVYHPCQGELAFSPHQIEAVLAAVVSLTRHLTGQVLPVQKVQFSQSQLGVLASYRRVFACQVEFDQAFSGLLVANALLDRSLPQADAQVARLHETHLAGRLARLNRKALPADDLRDWLASRVGQKLPTRAEAAQRLGVSERTLARRLAQKNETFDGLLDQVRRTLALQWVADTGRPLTDVAQALGFAEPSTFYRAFKRWTGDTPARWRKGALA